MLAGGIWGSANADPSARIAEVEVDAHVDGIFGRTPHSTTTVTQYSTKTATVTYTQTPGEP